MGAEVGATTNCWDEVSDEEWLKWKDMSGVASGISANLARHILTEHGIKVRKKLEKQGVFHVPLRCESCWVRVAHTIVRASREGQFELYLTK